MNKSATESLNIYVFKQKISEIPIATMSPAKKVLHETQKTRSQLIYVHK